MAVLVPVVLVKCRRASQVRRNDQPNRQRYDEDSFENGNPCWHSKRGWDLVWTDQKARYAYRVKYIWLTNNLSVSLFEILLQSEIKTSVSNKYNTVASAIKNLDTLGILEKSKGESRGKTFAYTAYLNKGKKSNFYVFYVCLQNKNRASAIAKQ